LFSKELDYHIDSWHSWNLVSRCQFCTICWHECLLQEV